MPTNAPPVVISTAKLDLVFSGDGLLSAPIGTGDDKARAVAVDASGNISGEVPYEVSFVVTDKNGFALQSVSPNPSTDKFYFKILLNGPSLPEDFQLTIYSSTGGLVRSFGNEVLNVLHVGTNEITVSALDATGDVLPTGIYLFHIATYKNGKRTTSRGRLVVVR